MTGPTADYTEWCLDCNGSGDTYGSDCSCCGQETYAHGVCPRCEGTGLERDEGVVALRREARARAGEDR